MHSRYKKRIAEKEEQTELQRRKTIKTLKKKLKQNNAIVTRADKGHTIVIINKEDYNHKINDFIQQQHFQELEKKNYIITYKNKLAKEIKNSKMTLEIYNAPKHIIPMNIKTPELYGQIKIYKQGLPLRPTVSFTDTPAIKIGKCLTKILLNTIAYKGTYTIKNNRERQ